eukprot:2995794-Rhodomonas_salina.2
MLHSMVPCGSGYPVRTGFKQRVHLSWLPILAGVMPSSTYAAAAILNTFKEVCRMSRLIDVDHSRTVAPAVVRVGLVDFVRLPVQSDKTSVAGANSATMIAAKPFLHTRVGIPTRVPGYPGYTGTQGTGTRVGVNPIGKYPGYRVPGFWSPTIAADVAGPRPMPSSTP